LWKIVYFGFGWWRNNNSRRKNRVEKNKLYIEFAFLIIGITATFIGFYFVKGIGYKENGFNLGFNSAVKMLLTGLSFIVFSVLMFLGIL